MENFPIDYQEAESGISSQSLIKLRIKQWRLSKVMQFLVGVDFVKLFEFPTGWI